ncbi:MAG: 23S rRNA (guanosine(2251)-2'-O)-methyltransferase RlmB [Elusimicrobia bacterium RIFCSPLOWO2_01_FULL_54_10]|nr:MAG: 23S rRNA (guanosine(2251)-2'-O)-methyltransferase RlmB [Elusimicrobia bacterium RIFCSPLOWO2_01_FULL_54_10]
MADWIYGRRSVLEVIKSGQSVGKVLLLQGPETPETREIRDAARQRNIPVENVEKFALNKITDGNHQGAAAVVESVTPVVFKVFLENLSVSPNTFVCLLDEIQDPQNLGAIIRNAVCFGCSGVILPKWRSAGITPAVMKSSSGALAHCPIAEISNLGVAIERLQEKGFTVYGADASEGSAALETLDIRRPAAIVLGSEHSGIKPTLKKACDQLVRISQKSSIQSLNVASASAIFFHAFSRWGNS